MKLPAQVELSFFMDTGQLLYTMTRRMEVEMIGCCTVCTESLQSVLNDAKLEWPIGCCTLLVQGMNIERFLVSREVPRRQGQLVHARVGFR